MQPVRAGFQRVEPLLADEQVVFARGALELGEPGGLLLSLQQRQGGPHSGRGGAEAGTETTAVYTAHLAAADAVDWASRRALA